MWLLRPVLFVLMHVKQYLLKTLVSFTRRHIFWGVLWLDRCFYCVQIMNFNQNWNLFQKYLKVSVNMWNDIFVNLETKYVIIYLKLWHSIIMKLVKKRGMCCLVVKQTITFCNDDKNWKMCIVSYILFQITTIFFIVFEANSLYYQFIIVIYRFIYDVII